ncbi:MAG: hybrid sensor histidine kinase/response regulator [Candidatus Riflebacteria bacterium]|nr:hybrid sensor histidine kinase/response regulator [Candidatus Riflebacteria bacterium]
MRLARIALVGFLNGYVVLHPVAMVVFALLHEAPGHCVGGGLSSTVSAQIIESFGLKMLPMAFAFGMLGSLVGLVYGLQALTIQSQRDDLRRELTRTDALMKELEAASGHLRRQNSQLVDLEKVKERTTRFLVHDFKNHLACITGFADVLLAKPLIHQDEALRRPLVRVRRQARLMATSVMNLLDIARLEAAPALRLRFVDPVELLESVLDDLDFGAKQVSIHLVRPSSPCPLVSMEPELIRRVVLNLAVNAVKHNDFRVEVVLTVEPRDDERMVQFTCRDSGTGIPPARIATLFDAHQLALDAPSDSTGLGLAFARSAVEAHGGRIWCESDLGSGAAFHFTLKAERSGSMMTRAKFPRRVLVVEDEPDCAALMESIIRSLGYDVDMASTGQEALERVTARRPDLITLDIQMPKKSGALFYRQLKSMESYRDIPVVVVSGLLGGDPAASTFVHSFLDVDHLPHPNAYLEKPVDRSALQELVGGLLGAPEHGKVESA